MKRREFIKRTAAGTTALAASEMWEFFWPRETQAHIRGGGIDIEDALEMLAIGKPGNIMPEIRPHILDNTNGIDENANSIVQRTNISEWF